MQRMVLILGVAATCGLEILHRLSFGPPEHLSVLFGQWSGAIPPLTA
jgi:hypothetical protein